MYVFLSYSEINKLSGNAEISISNLSDLSRVFSCSVTMQCYALLSMQTQTLQQRLCTTTVSSIVMSVRKKGEAVTMTDNR